MCTSIFTTYLRHDSISKLLFISGEVNKGDVLAVVINGSNKIIYVSENSSNFILVGHDELMNQDISILSVLPRGEGESKVNDGMEITICTFNHLTDELKYACAGSRFVHLHESLFTVCKGDSKHIGDYHENSGFKYTEYTIDFKVDDTIYLMSDGLQDQFEGAKIKKFNFKKIRILLDEINKFPMVIQKDRMIDEFNEWKSDFEQTDDVIVVGIRGVIKNNLNPFLDQK